jgi:transcriptional regulator NrdR family protein
VSWKTWQCPDCNGESTVYNSRAKVNGFVWRRRKCLSCGRRWTTYEVRS